MNNVGMLRVKNGVGVDYAAVASWLATEDNLEQAKFFDVFATELTKVCGSEYCTFRQLNAFKERMQPANRTLLSWEE